MFERGALEFEVVARLRLEPLGDSPMQAAAQVRRYVLDRRLPDQVVRKRHGAGAGLDHSARLERRHRALHALGRPALERRQVGERERPGGDSEQGQERCGVRARAGEAVGDQMPDRRARCMAGDQRLDPERRTVRPLANSI